MTWWAFSSFFGVGNPGGSITNLRYYTENKLAEFYPSGNFWFTHKSAVDGLPTLLISSKDAKVIDPKFIELAKPAKDSKVLVGTYAAKGAKGSGTYTFTLDAAKTDSAYVAK